VLSASGQKAREAVGQIDTSITASLSNYIDLDAWLESNISGEEFSHLVAERRKAQLGR